MNFFTALEILSSGLGAERARMNVTASNLANAKTTRSGSGGPYQRRDPVFAAVPHSSDPFASRLNDALRSVELDDVQIDGEGPQMLHDPGHPDANEEGYVAMPNINMVEETVNMMTAARAYESGVTAMKALIEMAERALTIGGGR